MRSFQRLCQRAKASDDKREMVKRRMEAAKSFNSTLPLRTPNAPPRIRPAWVLSRNNIREILHPLQAINFLIEQLDNGAMLM